MSLHSTRLRWPEALPRLVVDFAIVQLSFLAALLGASILALETRPTLSAASVVNEFRDFYIGQFLPLSPIFPLAFFFSGFYTRSRAYPAQYKFEVVLRGSLVAVLVYLAAHFIFHRAGVLPRSVLLCFIVLMGLGVTGVRLLKHRLVKQWMLIADGSSAPDHSVHEASKSPEAPILVVGGAGYIGSILCRKLLDQGARVRVLDSLVYGDAAIRELCSHPRFELHAGDCRHIQSAVGALAGVTSVVHLAAIVGDPACEQNRESALEINYAATRMLIEIARGYHVERFVFASSCSVYGATDLVMDEKSHVQPVSLYAETKVDSEAALLNADATDFHPTILRLATVFGHSPRPRFDLVVNLLTAKAHSEGVITIFNGQQWRPFIHVTDVAEAIMCVLRAPTLLVSRQTFNVGDSRLNHTLSEIASKIQAAFPASKIEHIENSDLRNYRVSFEKIRRQLGFQCRVTVDQGIREMQRAFEDRTVIDHTDIRYHNQRYLGQTGSPRHQGPLDKMVMAAFAGGS